jgi:hypothetical protein
MTGLTLLHAFSLSLIKLALEVGPFVLYYFFARIA